MQKTVGVLFGGRSSEHDISLRSAVYILQNLPENFKILPIGISKQGEFWSATKTFKKGDFQNITPQDLGAIAQGIPPKNLTQTHVFSMQKACFLPIPLNQTQNLNSNSFQILNTAADIFFPVLHGSNGEDGRLQGLFEMADLSYVGCDQRASVIGIDKNLQKRIAMQYGIPVAKYEEIEWEEWNKDTSEVLSRVTLNIGFPCFVKPNALGSAVGVNRAQNQDELKKHLQKVFELDEKALVEEPMKGSEVECAFLGTGTFPQISSAGEIVTQDFYSYQAKYISDAEAQLFIPARLSPERLEVLKQYCRQLARAFSLTGLCRLDFWNCNTPERFVFNEINTLPGLTSISMFPKLWAHDGLRAEDWIISLLEKAEKRQKHRSLLHFDVPS